MEQFIDFMSQNAPYILAFLIVFVIVISLLLTLIYKTIYKSINRKEAKFRKINRKLRK